MAISFETLRRLQEDEEKNKYTLQKIDDKFYGHIRDYLYEIDETYSDEEKDNIRRVIKKLFKLRLEKLIKIARLSLNTQMSVENGTLPEKEFIENIKIVILDYQKKIDKKTNPLKIKDSKTKKDFVKVKFNTDVFSFVMEDMKTYGPYKKNEEHVVPKNVATLLLKNKKIVISG